MFRLLYPLRYFMLDNEEKRWLDRWPTMILAILIALPYIFIPGASFFRANGLLDKMLTLTSCLTGFYVAALVAAATFSHPDLDNIITSGPIALVSKSADGEKIKDLLSRRRFACYIFGYLSFLSLIISVWSAVVVSLSTSILPHLFKTELFIWLRNIFLILSSAMIAHLVVATCLGLYYLMDRMYRRDRIITTPKSVEDEAA